MIRVQEVVLPVLKAALPTVLVVSWVPDVDHRSFPMISIARRGGVRNINLPSVYSLPVVDMTAVSADGLIEAEELYEDALDALYASVSDQNVIPGVGYLQSLREEQGASQVPSVYSDSWAVQGSFRVGVRSLP